ncbi:hypothetical protein M407DRAFT_32760 [Tulasnella calospora MUT 4182]|uniref:Uncharacterized protein n=1 Tax=Tulasnella calospora MUT 4182 TaxID=1051891 RepID=A0A0C3L7S1_9AGAM|nr:hypothetical protein M407DRAFT_32760 [Tulasnella calospora MUT 4182]
MVWLFYATILAANALASPFVPLEAGELDGLEAFSDGELNDIVPDLEHESISDGEDDGDLAVAFEPSPTAEPVRSSTDNYYQNYNAHILSILLALIHTGPNEMWSSSWLLPFLDQDRPLLTEGYDVTLEGALWRAVEEAEKIQENTGDMSLLDGTYDAMIMVWDTLELGELPDGVQ